MAAEVADIHRFIPFRGRHHGSIGLIRNRIWGIYSLGMKQTSYGRQPQEYNA